MAALQLPCTAGSMSIQHGGSMKKWDNYPHKEEPPMIQYNRQLVYQVQALQYDSVSEFTLLYLSSVIYYNTHKLNACINICKYNTLNIMCKVMNFIYQ